VHNRLKVGVSSARDEDGAPSVKEVMRHGGAHRRRSSQSEERRWAIEGASGIGRPLAQKLAASGEEVVDVPPKLSAKVRVLSTGNARKNDRLDATFTALAALRNERLARVHPEDGLEGCVTSSCTVRVTVALRTK
jgi:transposase